MAEAHTVTPEGLGHYLTGLVAEKNARYPEDDAELYAAGMMATVHALTQTHPERPTFAPRCQAAVMVMTRLLWPG